MVAATLRSCSSTKCAASLVVMCSKPISALEIVLIMEKELHQETFFTIKNIDMMMNFTMQ
jgi:hypothetical protein